jgi:hypothetical protein
MIEQVPGTSNSNLANCGTFSAWPFSGEKRLSDSRRRRPNIKFVSLLWLILLIVACQGSTPSTPTPPTLSSGTGIAVASEFQSYYDQHGGARVFGFPISSLYPDSESGRLLQYFQHLRLEYDQNGAVTVSPFGEIYAPSLDERVLAPESPNGGERTFPETGLTVRGEFLSFYETYDGELVFGPPITALLVEGGTLVQYFQNGMLSWNPNAPPEFRVEVAPLADAYLWEFGGPEDIFGIDDSAVITLATVRAAIKEPILYAGDEQVLYITVMTPDSLQPLDNITINATISYNDLSTEITFPERTDEMGQAQSVLRMPGVQPGDVVLVEIQAINSTGVIGTTTLSFRTWW